ncbi:MAG: hypothetical protein L3J10_02780 [Sulfurimonas sp.]|nr:hypothetical protein [Sulfurimonas sp.]
MSKKEQHSFSNVLSINPYKNTYVNAVSSFLNEIDTPSLSKDQYSISYLNTRGFINGNIAISKNIPDEDIYDAIYSKAYDDLGLDQAVEYQLQYIETFNNLDDENRNFHIFVIDPIIIKEVFKNTIDKIKYLDYIIPSPLLLKSLYSKHIIEDGDVHCFIYFQENDTFITIYNEKDFVYTKSINHSFIQMHERFCEIYGERIEYDNFIDFLSNANLKTTESNYKETLIKLYKEIFANISDVLTYVKRALDLNKINYIYIDSQIQTITKLDEMSEVELGIKSSNFNFDYGFESSENHIDQLHALMHVYTTLPTEERYECNFTIYHRPPKFIQRESGRAILLVAASLILTFIYPISYWSLTYAQNLQYDLLNEDYKELHNIKITREATIKNKEADKHKVTTLLNHEKDEYVQKKNTLIKIHDVKVNYPMKANLLYKFTKDLNRYKVKVESISYNEDSKTSLAKEIKFSLVSSKDKKITDLIRYLTRKYDGKFHFSINEISYIKESKLYFGELKVSLL